MIVVHKYIYIYYDKDTLLYKSSSYEVLYCGEKPVDDFTSSLLFVVILLVSGICKLLVDNRFKRSVVNRCCAYVAGTVRTLGFRDGRCRSFQ